MWYNLQNELQRDEWVNSILDEKKENNKNIILMSSSADGIKEKRKV